MNQCFRKNNPLLCLALLLPATGTFAQNTLTLDVGQAEHTINRTIYGALMEDWGRDMYGGIYVGEGSSIPNTDGMRNDVIEGFKEIGVGVLQFPGGCNAEEYNWRDGIGPKAGRPGGEMANGMGTDEYFKLCELVDCEPFIQANCLNGTPQMMAEWLDYIHQNYPGRLTYLGMGNEPWGGCFPGITAWAYMNTWYDPFSAAIPSVFDGKLIRVGAAFTALDQTEIVLQRGIGKMEGLSWHHYSTMSWTEGEKSDSYGFSETDYYNILQKGFDIEGGLRSTMQLLDEYDPDYTCGLQPDEWGVWINQIPGMGESFQQGSIRDALLAGQHLNFFNNNCHRIWMAQVAQPVNVIHSLFLTENPPTTQLIKTPTFYVFKLFKPHHNATMIPAPLECGTTPRNNLKVLTASASIDSTETVHISITNMHAQEAQTLAITLNDFTYSEASGKVVNGPAFNSINEFDQEEAVNIQPLPESNITKDSDAKLTVTLPAHSIVMLTLANPVSTSVRESGTPRDGFSVRAVSGNRVVITHGISRRTPVTLSLYSVDGKLLAPTSPAIADPETKTLLWKPQLHTRTAQAVVVSLKANGKTLSKRVVLQPER